MKWEMVGYNRVMSILGIGQSVYDIYFVVDGLPMNAKKRVSSSRKCMGGPASCAMYLCGKWGAQVSICTRIGKDAFGQEIENTLKSVNVCTDYMFIDENDSTSISGILVDQKNGNRSILNIPMNYLPPFPKKLPESCDVLFFDGHEMELSLFAYQKYPQAITIFDGDKYKPETLLLLKQVDYLICSVEFAQEITGHTMNEDTYQELCAINSHHVILTMGDQGCMYQNRIYPAYPAKVVDTTGSGDVFHGAFAFGLDQHWDIEKTIHVASAASSLCCEGLGGVVSVPDLDDVFMRMQMNCEFYNKNL